MFCSNSNKIIHLIQHIIIAAGVADDLSKNNNIQRNSNLNF